VTNPLLEVIIQVDEENVDLMLHRAIKAVSSESMVEWMAIGPLERVRLRARERFASEGGDMGGWAPLAPWTIRERIAKGFSPEPILHRTGELENYIVNGPFTIEGSEFGASLTMPDEAENPDLSIKFKATQTGSRTGQPSRSVIGLDLDDAYVLLEELGKYLEERIKLGV
jgi:hypothetical protein